MSELRRRGLLGVGLLFGLAACSEGCASQPLPVSDPSFAQQRMTIDQLEALLLPEGPGQWRALPEYQLFALERLLPLLIEQSERAGLSPGARRSVARFAHAAGLELHEVELDFEGRVERLWVIVEPPADRRGRGAYVVRLGTLEPAVAGRKTEYLLQAPHTRFDKHTGTIALRLFVEHDNALPLPRALFLNSVHRYAQVDGSRGKQGKAADNPADPTHREDHPFARATVRVLGVRELAIVQLHGFERNADAGDPEMIVSSGETQPDRSATATAARLRVYMPTFPVGLFGLDTDRLGATSNVQGHAARKLRRCFVHIETSEAVRKRLRDDRSTRRAFAAAVFGADAQELHGGCA